MKEIIFLLAMQFSQDFNKPINNIHYRVGDIDHFAVMRKLTNGYEITFDEALVERLSEQQVKTLVYHMTAKATGIDTTNMKRHFMNQKNILKPYKKLIH